MGRIAVIGGGHGGFAAAAHLTSQGHTVRLYNRSWETIAPVSVRRGVQYSGVFGSGFAPLELVTDDLAAAVTGVDLILVCLPATAHAGVARALAPLLEGACPVILNPGGTGGALVFRQAVQTAGARTAVPIGETNTLTYIARKSAPDSVYVSSVVRHIRFAALPGRAIGDLVERVRTLYPSLKPVPTVLHTALMNVNAILHPPGIVLAAAWIEHTGGDFRYYIDAGTPGVAQVMADLDRERVAIGAAWGIDLEPFTVLFADIGSTSAVPGASGSPHSGEAFYQMLQQSQPNSLIKAPPTLEHRYFHEDIPYGLVPMRELGRVVGVATPVMDALITLASSLTRTDFGRTGWTLERLGLSDDRAAVQELLLNGRYGRANDGA